MLGKGFLIVLFSSIDIDFSSVTVKTITRRFPWCFSRSNCRSIDFLTGNITYTSSVHTRSWTDRYARHVRAYARSPSIHRWSLLKKVNERKTNEETLWIDEAGNSRALVIADQTTSKIKARSQDVARVPFSSVLGFVCSGEQRILSFLLFWMWSWRSWPHKRLFKTPGVARGSPVNDWRLHSHYYQFSSVIWWATAMKWSLPRLTNK